MGLLLGQPWARSTEPVAAAVGPVLAAGVWWWHWGQAAAAGLVDGGGDPGVGQWSGSAVSPSDCGRGPRAVVEHGSHRASKLGLQSKF